MIAREGGTWAQRGFIAGAVACAGRLGGLRKGEVSARLGGGCSADFMEDGNRFGKIVSCRGTVLLIVRRS